MLPCSKHPFIRAVQRRSKRGVAGDIVNIAKTALQVTNDCRNTIIDYRFQVVGERKDVAWNAFPLSQKQKLEWVKVSEPCILDVQVTTAKGDPSFDDKWKLIWEASSNCTSVVCVVACIAQTRLEQGKDIAVSSRSLGCYCKILDLHIVTGVWNGVCNNPLLAFPGEYRFMLEEAIVNGYKHMWLELTVLKPNGSETVLSMGPAAAQFGSPQPIVTWHSNNPEPGKHYLPHFKESTKRAVDQVQFLLDHLDKTCPGGSHDNLY
jgi:hypothetical protein